ENRGSAALGPGFRFAQPGLRIGPRQSAFMPWICQGLAAEPGEPPPITDVPLMNHSTNCPLPVLYQRMSLLPSALNSPVPATDQGLAAEPGDPPPITVEPFISHTTAWPLVVLYQRMSPKPSPLKSPVPATDQGLAAEPGDPPPITVAPLSSHSTTC